jgi:hypothetical protein
LANTAYANVLPEWSGNHQYEASYYENAPIPYHQLPFRYQQKYRHEKPQRREKNHTANWGRNAMYDADAMAENPCQSQPTLRSPFETLIEFVARNRVRIFSPLSRALRDVMERNCCDCEERWVDDEGMIRSRLFLYEPQPPLGHGFGSEC